MLPIVISAIECPEDRDLMSRFYIEYNARLYIEARKYLQNPEDAEDVVLEGLTKIIEKMDIFRTLAPRAKVQYAITTVKNLSYNLLKRNDRLTTVPFDELDFSALIDPSPTEETAERNMLIERTAAIWNSLDLEDRTILEQKYILQWSDDELAVSLGIKSQSVRMRLTRAMRRLTQCFPSERHISRRTIRASIFPRF